MLSDEGDDAAVVEAAGAVVNFETAVPFEAAGAVVNFETAVTFEAAVIFHAAVVYGA